MKPVGGKFTTTGRVFGGCSNSEACPVCQMCKNWSPRLAMCRECYPKRWHCYCAARGIDELANQVSRKLDTPFIDRNNPTKGDVQVHRDPFEDFKGIRMEHEDE